MAEQIEGGEPTLTLSDSMAAPRLVLVVFGDRVSATYRLPKLGSLTLGREDGVDVVIRERSISRRHAVLHMQGEEIWIEDLGSANGTWVGDSRLPPRERTRLSPGQSARVASRSIVVQRLEGAQAAGAEGAGGFERRLAETCARAVQQGVQCGLARFVIEGPAWGADVERALKQVLPQRHLLGADGAGEYQALLWGCDEAEATESVRAAAAQLGRASLRVSFGLAFCPRDARTPAQWVEAASPRPAPLRAALEDAKIVVSDRQMRSLHELIARLAQGAINVLLLGETGVGKEVFAEQLHRLSPRASKPLLRLNCGGLSEALLDSELFGHEKGAFTGAVQTKMGLLEAAEGGTVFLDEMGELPMALQSKLLRVLEDRQVRRVGSVKGRAVDVRFVSATNRDLQKEVAAGRFRQDLFFRLNGVSVVIPPLRERTGEIEALARTFLAEAGVRSGLPDPEGISRQALELLQRYSWPGNIRELRNAIERAALMCLGPVILPEHLPAEVRAGSGGWAGSTDVRGTGSPAGGLDAGSERERILRALEQCAGNQTRAAQLLGMARNTLIARLKEYGVARPRSPSAAEPHGDC